MERGIIIHHHACATLTPPRPHFTVTTIAQYVSSGSTPLLRSPRKARLSIAHTVNMTALKSSLQQSNQGEIAMNGAFSAAWGLRAQTLRGWMTPAPKAKMVLTD